MKKGHILIVDPEDSTVQPLAKRFDDEGFEVLCLSNGPEALTHRYTTPPDVVLLELWLPGMDGIELLQRFKHRSGDMIIIVMSGHGNIATAVQAIKLGAYDYVEKPLRPEDMLHTVQRALAARKFGASALPMSHPSQPQSPASVPARGATNLSRPAPQTQVCATLSERQRTLRHSIVLRGQGLQSGIKTGMILTPCPPDHGLVFRNITTGNTVPACVDFVASTDFCTNLRQGGVVANTVEHLMSALHAYRITNLLIQIADEVPIMDGSAAAFCQLIEDAGVAEQDAPVESFLVDRRYQVGEISSDTKFILVEPYDGFRITYRANYPPPIGIQEWTYEHCDGADYRCKIGLARTFAFVEDVEAMHAVGLIAGARLTNAILIGPTKIVNSPPLRFANEFVRHKILDIMGDLYLLGKPMRGQVRAHMTGHTENVTLMRRLRATMIPN